MKKLFCYLLPSVLCIASTFAQTRTHKVGKSLTMIDTYGKDNAFEYLQIPANTVFVFLTPQTIAKHWVLDSAGNIYIEASCVDKKSETIVAAFLIPALCERDYLRRAATDPVLLQKEARQAAAVYTKGLQRHFLESIYQGNVPASDKEDYEQIVAGQLQLLAQIAQ